MNAERDLMVIGNAFNNGEAQTVAARLIGLIRFFKAVKDGGNIFRGHSNAGVYDTYTI